jgi:hypothetical protein
VTLPLPRAPRPPTPAAACPGGSASARAPPPPPDDSSDDDEDEEDALYLAALAQVEAEEEEQQQQQQQEEEQGERGVDDDDDDDDDLLLSSSTGPSVGVGDPYLLPGFGIEDEDDDEDDDEAQQQQQPPPRSSNSSSSGRRRKPVLLPSRASTLRALADAVLAADRDDAASKQPVPSLSSGEIVRALGTWAGLCHNAAGAARRTPPPPPTGKELAALRALLLAAAARPLTPGQAARALRAAAQCASAAPAAGLESPSLVLPWTALAALFGKLVLPPPRGATAGTPPLLLQPDLAPRAACEALWAAGALHARSSQDAAARRAAEREAALAPPPLPSPPQRSANDRRRPPLRTPGPPAPLPGQDARSELARIFMREDGVAGTLPPAPPSGSAATVPLVRSEAQDHALAVEASRRAAAEATAQADAPPPLPGVPTEVLTPACRFCDAFVASLESPSSSLASALSDDAGSSTTTTPPIPLPELAAAAAAVARLQRPTGQLFRLIEARLCSRGAAELTTAATRDLATIAWAAGTAAEDAVSGPAAPAAAGAALPHAAAKTAQSIAPRSLMAALASECRRRLVQDAEVAARFVAVAEGALAAREQRARGVPTSAALLWPDAEAAAQLRDAELPASRSRRQLEWLAEVDDFLRREALPAAGVEDVAALLPTALAPPPPLPALALDLPADTTTNTTNTPISPRLALFPSEGEHHLRPGGLMDRLAAADAARRGAAAAATSARAAETWRLLPAERRVGPAEAATFLVASARAAYLDDGLVDACLRAHGDAWARAAGTGAGTWPLRAAARPPRVRSSRQRGALARVTWALALLGRCPAHDDDGLLKHAADALAGSEAGVLSALPGDVLDLTRALAAGRVRLPPAALRRWTSRGIARAVAEGAGLGVVAARRWRREVVTKTNTTPPSVVLPTPADALLPDQLAALALAAARLPRGAGAAAWSPPTALAAISPWLTLVAPLCSPVGLSDLAEAYALDGRPADDGGAGLAPVVDAAAAWLLQAEEGDGDAGAATAAATVATLGRLLRALLLRSEEAERQLRAVLRRRARLARGEGLGHWQEEEDEVEEEAASATTAAATAVLSTPGSSPIARDHALESLPWRARQRLRGSAAAPGRALLRAQGALLPPSGRVTLADAPYLPADASDAAVEARWRAMKACGRPRASVDDDEDDLAPLERAAAPDLGPLLRAADGRLRPRLLLLSREGSGGGGGGGALGKRLALDLLRALEMTSRDDGYDRERLAAWLEEEAKADV